MTDPDRDPFFPAMYAIIAAIPIGIILAMLLIMWIEGDFR